MPRRTCDACGKEKDVSGGKTCERGHFICKDCVWKVPQFLRTARESNLSSEEWDELIELIKEKRR